MTSFEIPPIQVGRFVWPWKLYRRTKNYDCILCTTGVITFRTIFFKFPQRCRYNFLVADVFTRATLC